MGKLIKIYKLRSMCKNAEKNGAQWADKDYDRITNVGKFIRKTRIDELQQLINVVKGEMSFIGPRPERPEFVELFSSGIIYFNALSPNAPCPSSRRPGARTGPVSPTEKFGKL